MPYISLEVLLWEIRNYTFIVVCTRVALFQNLLDSITILIPIVKVVSNIMKLELFLCDGRFLNNFNYNYVNFFLNQHSPYVKREELILYNHGQGQINLAFFQITMKENPVCSKSIFGIHSLHLHKTELPDTLTLAGNMVSYSCGWWKGDAISKVKMVHLKETQERSAITPHEK